MHLITAGFNTFRDTLLDGLFNVRFKALPSSTQPWYLIHCITHHMCGEPGTTLRPASTPLRVSRKVLPATKSGPAPAPPTCTDCLQPSGSALPSVWVSQDQTWQWARSPTHLHIALITFSDLNPLCTLIKTAHKNDSEYITHSISHLQTTSHPRPWATDPHSSLFKTFVTFFRVYNHF